VEFPSKYLLSRETIDAIESFVRNFGKLYEPPVHTETEGKIYSRWAWTSGSVVMDCVLSLVVEERSTRVETACTYRSAEGLFVPQDYEYYENVPTNLENITASMDAQFKIIAEELWWFLDESEFSFDLE
jgi:cell division protein YceG involved in septum cleavage